MEMLIILNVHFRPLKPLLIVIADKNYSDWKARPKSRFIVYGYLKYVTKL